MTVGYRIDRATSSADIEAARLLMQAYAASLPIDLCFQGFDEEMRDLPGKYAPPTGALLLARSVAGDAHGCVALRGMDAAGCCEMKRMYVAPAARGSGLGRQLADDILAEGRRIGYREMRLDTLPTLTSAIALYRSLGFVDCAPYYHNPNPGVIFLSCRL